MDETELAAEIAALRLQYTQVLTPLERPPPSSLASEIPMSQILGEREHTAAVAFFCGYCKVEVSDRILHLLQCYGVSESDLILFGSDGALEMHRRRGISNASGLLAEQLWIEIRDGSGAIARYHAALRGLGLPARLTTTSELRKSLRSRHDIQRINLADEPTKASVEESADDADNADDVDVNADVLVLDVPDEHGLLHTFQVDAIRFDNTRLIIEELRCGRKQSNAAMRELERRFELIGRHCQKLGISVAFEVVMMLVTSEFIDHPERTLPKRMRGGPITPVLGDVAARDAGFSHNDFVRRLRRKAVPSDDIGRTEEV